MDRPRRKDCNWYAVHAVLYFDVPSQRRSSIKVWENIYLVRAGSFEEARNRGMALAKSAEGDSDESTTLDGAKARLRVMGIRKVIECLGDATHCRPARVTVPHDGMEVSYSEYIVADGKALDALVLNRDVRLTYEGVPPSSLSSIPPRKRRATKKRPRSNARKVTS